MSWDHIVNEYEQQISREGNKSQNNMDGNPGMTECNPRITKSWNDMDANPGMTGHPGISCDRSNKTLLVDRVGFC